MKFCSNLSFMFTEYSFLERYKFAKLAGFRAVESGFPFGFSIIDVVNAKETAQVEQILINIYTGDVGKGQLGFASVPGKEKEFVDSLQTTINYAKALNCKKIHLMSGLIVENDNYTNEERMKTYESNLRYAENQLRNEGILGLIEPINNYTVPNYFLNSYEKGLEIVKKVNSPFLRLMIDVFHLQQIEGNITRSLKELLPFTGHIQIAQVPNRNEPNVPGELDYKYILKLLEQLQYSDWIGLEYKPKVQTEQSIQWIQEFGYKL